MSGCHLFSSSSHLFDYCSAAGAEESLRSERSSPQSTEADTYLSGEED